MSKENSLDLQAKFRYIRRILRHRLRQQPRICPYCGPSSKVHLVQRKKIIVEILQCQTCHLWFRWPSDTPDEHDAYYQEEFAGDTHQVALPCESQLKKLRETNFVGSPLDISNKMQVLCALREGGRVLDYGSSWGYGTYQLRSYGFDAVGFEISRPRAEFGRKQLGLSIIDAESDLEKIPSESFDIIFSNHVIEHLPNVAIGLSLMTRLLKKGGFVFHVLPNFAGKKARSGYWIKWIGEDHPIAPAIPFFELAIPRAGLAAPVFGSDPFDGSLAQALKAGGPNSLPTEGDELLVYANRIY